MVRIPLLTMAAICCAAQTVEQPVRGVTDPGVITTRQAITPAGVPSVFQGRVYGVAWAGNSGELWVLHATQLYRLDGRIIAWWRAARLEELPGISPSPPIPRLAKC
jgi:hypothetical protein